MTTRLANGISGGAAPLVAVTPYGPAAGSTRVRIIDWIRHTGVDTSMSNYLGAADASARSLLASPAALAHAEWRIRTLARQRFRRLLLQREATPFSKGGVEGRLLRSADWGVYDFDDALQWDDGGGLVRRAFSKPAKCAAAVRAADLVIAGNELLANWASTMARDVVVIPSCVEPRDYLPKPSYRLGDPPRLVWMGSPATERFLISVTRPLLEVHRRTGARLLVVSAGRRTLGPLDRMVDRVPWSRDTFGVVLTEADIAVAPLADEPYARGKCAYKILQYAACGLPIVGSPVGANRKALMLLGGRIAESGAEWVAQLLACFGASDGERQAMGELSRRAVGAHYSFARWASAWLAALRLEEVVPGTPSTRLPAPHE